MSRFSYYDRLTRRQQAIYRSSDAISDCRIPQPEALGDTLVLLAHALRAENRIQAQQVCNEITRSLAKQLAVSQVKVKVLSTRPSNEHSELHGLYEPETLIISVWMRTAQRKQVVAFKTFLRTVLHEFCHHLDYTLYSLEDSFHTEGFYKRESSVYKQLLSVYEAKMECMATKFTENTGIKT